MPENRGWLVWGSLCWLLAGAGTITAYAQLHAMPPSTAVGRENRQNTAEDAAVADIPWLAVPTTRHFQKAGGTGDEYATTAATGFPLVHMNTVGPGRQQFLGNGWSWQWSPDGLMYPAYLAGGRESRFASHLLRERDKGALWDVTLGGHVGMLRYGNRDPLLPEGWQLDIEGAAFPRLTLDHYRDLVSADFRFGVPLTLRRGPWEAKLGYYHLSSHLGDEFLAKHVGATRINYVRDVIVWAVALRPHEDLRLYAEAGWAAYVSGGSEPWEFQFGIDYSPIYPTSFLGAPFFAVNGRIREEVDFGGNMTVQTGWQWRGETGRLLRFGFHYFNGKTDQYQFFREHEEQFAIGIWYDY